MDCETCKTTSENPDVIMNKWEEHLNERIVIIAGETCPKCKTVEMFCKSKGISAQVVKKSADEILYESLLIQLDTKVAPTIYDKETKEIIKDLSPCIAYLKKTFNV